MMNKIQVQSPSKTRDLPAWMTKKINRNIYASEFTEKSQKISNRHESTLYVMTEKELLDFAKSVLSDSDKSDVVPESSSSKSNIEFTQLQQKPEGTNIAPQHINEKTTRDHEKMPKDCSETIKDMDETAALHTKILDEIFKDDGSPRKKSPHGSTRRREKDKCTSKDSVSSNAKHTHSIFDEIFG